MPAVEILANSSKSSDLKKTDVFQCNLFQNHEKIGQSCCHEDFSRVCDPLAHWLSKGVLEQVLLDILVTISFVVSNFEHT